MSKNLGRLKEGLLRNGNIKRKMKVEAQGENIEF
jgi:hypothetical protein